MPPESRRADTVGALMVAADALCVCGHEWRAHEHHRRGTDCTLCGASACPRFRRRRWWHALVSRAA